MPVYQAMLDLANGKVGYLEVVAPDLAAAYHRAAVEVADRVPGAVIRGVTEVEMGDAVWVAAERGKVRLAPPS